MRVSLAPPARRASTVVDLAQATALPAEAARTSCRWGRGIRSANLVHHAPPPDSVWAAAIAAPARARAAQSANTRMSTAVGTRDAQPARTAVLALTVSAVAAAALARVQAARRASSRLLALPPGGSKAAVRASRVPRARSEKVVAVAALVCALSASTASSRWTRAYGMPSASPFLRALQASVGSARTSALPGHAPAVRAVSSSWMLASGMRRACRVRRAGPVSSELGVAARVPENALHAHMECTRLVCTQEHAWLAVRVDPAFR